MAYIRTAASPNEVLHHPVNPHNHRYVNPYRPPVWGPPRYPPLHQSEQAAAAALEWVSETRVEPTRNRRVGPNERTGSVEFRRRPTRCFTIRFDCGFATGSTSSAVHRIHPGTNRLAQRRPNTHILLEPTRSQHHHRLRHMDRLHTKMITTTTVPTMRS